VIILFVLMVLPASAAVMEIVGGIRNGAAAGLQLESPVAKNLTIRGAIESNTSNQPIFGLLGLKMPLTSLGRMPLGLGLGFVLYQGENKSSPGFSLTFIFNRFLDINPLFLELGVDVVGSGRLVAQLGYKVY
ncbi:MAG: hypothetical protein ACPL4K_06335, partial [Candidatus Margulisiibacteriota bacterium]